MTLSIPVWAVVAAYTAFTFCIWLFWMTDFRSPRNRSYITLMAMTWFVSIPLLAMSHFLDRISNGRH